MRVKVCGITLVRDMRLAEAAGAEYIGFVVEAPSPRAVSRFVAAMLARAARAKPVYVTVDMAIDELCRMVELQRPAAVQLHGHEDSEAVRELRRRVGQGVELWKALAVRDRDTLSRACQEAEVFAAAGVDRVLLDTRVGGRGGEESGKFPLELAAEAVQAMPLPCIIAGGLVPEILPAVWEQARPWALDISSGLERQPGQKDPGRMRELAEVIAAG